MTHLTEEQLILHYYGEPEGGAAAEHLSVCAGCRAEYAAVQRDLNTMNGLSVPERMPEYGAAVWSRLEPRLEIRRRRARAGGFPRWAFAGAICALLAMAFLAGRWSLRAPARVETAQAASQQVRERVLLVALGDHLERSQRVLVELSNDGSRPEGDLREQAEELLADNRLYRQAAVRDREPGLASVLDDLERLLADVAHASDEDWEAIRQRMADQGILFKVRVVESNVRQREKDPLPVVRN
ncbi:MAG: hypothetical protein IT161_04835 [Bryobacterales bacterium]|nr:hypothetical protein [Bryobacterales bacterium]